MRDELWDQFVASWGEPIPKMQLAHREWDHTETAKRPEAVAAARGYWSWLKQHPKPPSAQSAQSFLRDRTSWAQWLRYVPDAQGHSPSIMTIFASDSLEAKALHVLHEIAGKVDFFMMVHRRGDGTVSYPKPISPPMAALAQAPPPAEWVELSHQQAGAWEEMLREAVVVQVRNRLHEGSRAPWPWPPSAEGKIYEVANEDQK